MTRDVTGPAKNAGSNSRNHAADRPWNRFQVCRSLFAQSRLERLPKRNGVCHCGSLLGLILNGNRLRGLPFKMSPRSEPPWRSEEHTSELPSHLNLVFRLLL